MKILGSDFDGTLTQGGIGEAKCAVIRAWRAAGHRFGIISGRGRDFLWDLRERYPMLELDFFASCNGGYITDGEGRVLYEARCETVSVPQFAASLLAGGCKYVHLNGENYLCVVARKEDAPSWVTPQSIILAEDLTPPAYFNQISVNLPTETESAEMVERIREHYGEWLNPLQNGTCIDIVPCGVDKAKGLYRVMEHFGGRFDDVIAVGDNVNDADMIREFRSYAMKNGIDLIKKLADAVVEDVTDLLKIEM